MMYHGTKTTTKDIDLVFLTERELQLFREGSLKTGKFNISAPDGHYGQLNTNSIIVDQAEHQLDLFVEKVCNGLILSEGMVDRSREVMNVGNLKLNVVSIEDIFLFKGITERPHDLIDMYSLAGAKLNWDTIENELLEQPENWKWIWDYYSRLVELKETHGVESPSIRRLKKSADISCGICAMYQILSTKPLTIEEIRQLDSDIDEIVIQEILDEMKNHKLIEIEDEKYRIK